LRELKGSARPRPSIASPRPCAGRTPSSACTSLPATPSLWWVASTSGSSRKTADQNSKCRKSCSCRAALNSIASP
jgi:hypothetical protein